MDLILIRIFSKILQVEKENVMAQQFNPQGMNTQNIKKRYAVLVFLKGSTAPLVLYVKDAQALYNDLVLKMQSPSSTLVEKETEGPLKKVSFISNQISAIAIQEEQFVQ
jgi:hypothetical protein